MPEIVIRDTTIGNIKEGNTLFGSTVTRVTVGTKWVTVWLNPAVDGKTRWAFELGTWMEIGKLEPTAEEREAKHQEDLQYERDYVVEWIDKQVAAHEDVLVNAIGALNPEWLRYNDLDAVVYADAYRQIYGHFGSFMERAREQKLHKAHVDGTEECEYSEPGENGYRCVKPTVPTDAYDGVVLCVNWLTDQLLTKAAGFRASSRSTNQMSNLMDDVYLEALGKVIRDLRFACGSELRDLLPKVW